MIAQELRPSGEHGNLARMNITELKETVRALEPKDRRALARFLQCLEVQDDPEWRRIVREAAQLRATAEKGMHRQRASRRSKTRAA